MVQIINRLPNFRGDTCQKIDSSKRVCSLSKNQFSRISEPFSELMKDGVISSTLDDLKRATSRARDKAFARIRRKEMERNGGYVLISGLTCIGTLIIGAIIFMTIGHLVLK